MGKNIWGIWNIRLFDMEIGQAASLIRELPTAGQIVRETVAEYEAGLQGLVRQAGPGAALAADEQGYAR